MLIRRATQADAAALSALICDNAQLTLAAHYSELQMQIFLRYYDLESVQQNLKKQTIFCAERDGQIIGSVGLIDNFIVGFYTHINFMGQGVGSQLMRHLHAYALSIGVKQLRLSASPAAVEFYLKLGYQIVEQIKPLYLGVAFDETLMAIELQ